MRLWLPASPADLPFPWRRSSSIGGAIPGAPGGPGTGPGLGSGTTPTSPDPVAPQARAARRILLIDDDTAVREVLAEMLRTADYEVVEAASGVAALSILRSTPFDLVFTDLGMPDMNGWEVAARVRAVRPNTRVGIITGWDVRIDESRRRALGVEVVIVKPFRLQHVLDTVRGALDG